jgi:hypothetical protein
MAINLSQVDFDDALKSHRVTVDRISATGSTQYDETTRAGNLYLKMKSMLEEDQKAELGIMIGTDATNRYNAMKSKLAAVLQFQADAQGITLSDLLDDLKTVEQPAQFTTIRNAIANA